MSSRSEQWLRTARVLRRAGFGTTGPEVDAVVKLGADKFIAACLAQPLNADPGVVQTPVPDLGPASAPVLTQTQLRTGEQDPVFREQIETLGQWWIMRLVAARNPLSEKLTWIWHDHFATSAEKVRNAPALVVQNETLRAKARGDFGVLLRSMIVDPAMIFWLDGQTNTIPVPNENFARELLERFGLGLDGGYREADVHEVARALTGFRLSTLERVSFDPAAHDSGIKSILGSTGNFGAAQLPQLIVARPESTTFIVRKLWRYFASDEAPSQAVIERISTAYGSRRNISAAVRAIFADEAFAAAEGTVINSPVEWLIGALRALKVPVYTAPAAQSILNALAALGQSPFYPPDVAGWPGGRAWLSTTAISVRARLAQYLADSADVSVIEETAAGDRVDAVGYLLGVGQFSTSTTHVLDASRKDPRKLVSLALTSPEYLTS